MGTGIRVTCSQCGATYRIESGIAPGEPAGCPKCGAKAVVPLLQEAETAIGHATLAGSPDDRQVTLVLPSGETPTLAQRQDGERESVEAVLRVAGPVSGRYIERGVIAQGGMGEIVLCIDRDTRRPVAMKRMLAATADDPSRRARFVEEAQVTAQLEHPNIVPVHELARRDDGSVYFTMKLVKGKSLADILAQAKAGKESPSLGELLQVFLKVCDGVAFAHSRGVLHRDLKPANIMVGDFGEVLVMDWGLAKTIGREDGVGAGPRARPAQESGQTQGPAPTPSSEGRVVTDRQEVTALHTLAGSMLGTPAYMPPEQAKAELEKIDQRSDTYSLGAILYETLTLERAIEGETSYAVLANVLKANIVPPEQRAPRRNVPRELSAITMKCLSKARTRRYASVMELRRDISLFLEGRSVSAKPDTFGQAVVKLVKRNRGVSAAVGAAVVIVIALATYSYVKIVSALDRAVVGEAKAMTNEKAAVAAQQQQRATALAASERFAGQAALAAENYRWAEADERLGDAQAVCPDGPWAPYARGRMAQIKGDHEGAIKLFSEALTISPGQREIASARDKSVSLLQRVAEARKTLKEGAKLANWQVAEKIGDTLDEAENWREAAAAYAQALQLLPPSVSRDELENKLGNARAWVMCEGFHESIRSLPPREQVKRIMAKLSEVHGKPIIINDSREQNGQLCYIQMRRDPLTPYLHPFRGLRLEYLEVFGGRLFDLRPLKGMPLDSLFIEGPWLRDLTPLRGVRLKYLRISRTRVSDLGPLQGMPLASLDISSCPVADLSPLRGMPLEDLRGEGTNVSDLSPLHGMPLKKLNLRGAQRISDLSPLKDCPLESLELPFCSLVEDLSPLKGLPLRLLDLAGTRVQDLSPLAGSQIATLHISGTRVTDLRPIGGLRLQSLTFTPESVKAGMDVLRAIGTLKVIRVEQVGPMPRAEFWKRYDAGEFSK